MTPLAQAAAEGGANVAEIIMFGVFGVFAVGTAIAVVTLRNVVHAALMLVVNLLSVAGLYLALQSSFLSIIQVIVYAGAIVVLFLFVIMLLGVQRDDDLMDRTRWHIAGGVLGGVALAGLLAAGFVGTYTTDASRCGPQGQLAPQDVRDGRVGCVGLDHLAAGADVEPNAQPTGGAAPPAEGATSPAEFLGERLFTRYTFAFEAAGLLLVVATIGALVLGRRADTPPDDDPAYEPAWAPPPLDDLDELDRDPDDAGDNELDGRDDPNHSATSDSAPGSWEVN